MGPSAPLGLDRLQVTDPDGEAITYTFAAVTWSRRLGRMAVCYFVEPTRTASSWRRCDLDDRHHDDATRIERVRSQAGTRPRAELVEVSSPSTNSAGWCGTCRQTVRPSSPTKAARPGQRQPGLATPSRRSSTTQQDYCWRRADADGYRVTLDRDDLGRVRSVTDGVLATHFDYDPAGQCRSARSRPVARPLPSSVPKAWCSPCCSPAVHGLRCGTTPPERLQAIGSNSDEAELLADVAPTIPKAGTDVVDEIASTSDGVEYRYSVGSISPATTPGVG